MKPRPSVRWKIWGKSAPGKGKGFKTSERNNLFFGQKKMGEKLKIQTSPTKSGVPHRQVGRPSSKEAEEEKKRRKNLVRKKIQ